MPLAALRHTSCWGGILATGAKMKKIGGVVVIAQERLDEVLAKAEEFFAKEEAMVAEIRAGKSMLAVDAKYGYEKMLRQ